MSSHDFRPFRVESSMGHSKMENTERVWCFDPKMILLGWGWILGLFLAAGTSVRRS